MQKKSQVRDLSPMQQEDHEVTKTKRGKKPVQPKVEFVDDEESTNNEDPFKEDNLTLSEKYLDLSQYGNIKIANTQQDLKQNKFQTVWKGADQILLGMTDQQPKNSKDNFTQDLKIGGGFRYYRSPENAFKKKDALPVPSKDHKWMLYFNLSIPVKFDHELSSFKFSSQSGKPVPILSPELSLKLLEEIVKLENIKYNNKD